MVITAGVAKCDKCARMTIMTGQAFVGTHGNMRVEWSWPPGWEVNTTPQHAFRNTLTCAYCLGKAARPSTDIDAAVLDNMVAVVKADATVEEKIGALKMLLATQNV